jgi:serine/threonine protein kinase
MSVETRLLGTPQNAKPSSTNPSLSSEVPDIVEDYAIVRAIGQGGMGTVFEVNHEQLGKRFALKLMSDLLRDNAEAVVRFRSETLALGKLDHPNIVSAVDAGVWQGRPFLVTELLKGQDLSARVAANGKFFEVDEVISIAIQLTDALEYAHKQGYFHRDIKPSNILVQPDGKAKLLDFGLVRSESNSMTRIGSFMGTVDYVAPEQASNASQAGAASDIYSLGCTLIYLLSGQVPFPDDRYPTLTAKLTAHLSATPEWFNQQSLGHPDWLVGLIRSMVAKSVDQRPSSCGEIHSILIERKFQNSKKCLSPRKNSKWFLHKTLLAVGSVLSALIAFGGWALTSHAKKNEKGFAPIVQPAETETAARKEPAGKEAKGNKANERTLAVTKTNNARGVQLNLKPSSTTSHSVPSSKDSSNE